MSTINIRANTCEHSSPKSFSADLFFHNIQRDVGLIAVNVVFP